MTLPQVHKIVGKTRSDDLGRLKLCFLAISKLDKLKENLKRKADRGFNSLITGRLLMPITKLEEFDEESDSTWTYPCRCGGTYVATEEMLDSGEHLVGCASCSEVVWVGYELAEEAENVQPQ